MSAPIRVVPAGANVHDPGDDAAPGSVLDTLRRAAAAQAQEQTHHLPIGGAFGAQLLARYRVLDVDELQRFQGLGGKLAEINIAIEMMVSTCTGLVWVDERGERNDLGVALEPRLWEVMGWPLPAGVDDVNDMLAREVVVKLFGGNGSLLAVHLTKLSEWLQNPGQASPGESSAAT